MGYFALALLTTTDRRTSPRCHQSRRLCHQEKANYTGRHIARLGRESLDVHGCATEVSLTRLSASRTFRSVQTIELCKQRAPHRYLIMEHLGCFSFKLYHHLYMDSEYAEYMYKANDHHRVLGGIGDA